MNAAKLGERAEVFDGREPVAARYGLAHEPGAEQRALIAATLRGIAAGAPVNLFPGAAGTGKTTTLKVLLAVLAECGCSVTIAAPTHKAAGRASEALDGCEVVTVHRIIYAGANERADCPACAVPLVEAKCPQCGKVEEFADDLAFNAREPGTAKVGDVLVIDEASMIGDGLARDIAAAIPTGTRIVAVGDPHQLPPVLDTAGFPLHTAPLALTTVYRQAEGSPVLTAATAIRYERAPFTFSPCGARWKRGEQILATAGVPAAWHSSAQAGAILAGMIRRNAGDAVAVVGVHTSRVGLNDAARAALHGGARRDAGPAIGERLIVRATGAGLANADMLTVLAVEPADFGARFGRGWVVRVQTERNRTREIAILAASWTCDEAKHRGLTPRSVRERMDAYKAEDIAAHGAAIAARVAAFQAADPEAPAWRVEIEAARIAREVGAWALYLDTFLAAVDTGYAITCHAAQGSQYAEVMIVADVVDFLADGDPEQVYRWSYTALTRAVKSALVVKKSKGGW